MSSLSATQADGYYIPPEHFLSGQYKKKTRNQLAAVGNQKGHNQFLQKGVVRFEIPYHGFCEHCGAHVGIGTRFNATKHTAGSYFTSPIYEFRMTCRICNAMEFCIRTNPKQQGFDYVSGLYRQKLHHEQQNQQWQRHDASNTATTTATTATTATSTTTTAFSQLETIAAGQKKAVTTEHDALRVLIADTRYAQDVSHNALLRTSFRSDRREKRARLEAGKLLGWRDGMAVESKDLLRDVISAKSTTFSNGKHMERKKFLALRTSSIFAPSTVSSSTVKNHKTTRPREMVDVAAVPDQVASQALTTIVNETSMVSGSSSSPSPPCNSHNISSSSRTMIAMPKLVKEKKTLVLTTKPGKVAAVVAKPPVVAVPTALDVLATYYDSSSDDGE